MIFGVDISQENFPKLRARSLDKGYKSVELYIKSLIDVDLLKVIPAKSLEIKLSEDKA